MLNLLKNLDLPPHIYIRILNCKKKFKTLEDILMTNPEEIVRITKLSASDLNILLNKIALKIINKNGGEDILKPTKYIKSPYNLKNAIDIDLKIKGKLLVNGIIELSGQSGVGKTQFCLHLSLQLALSNFEDNKVNCILYISTENSFPIKRFEQMINSAPVIQRNSTILTSLMDFIYLDHIGDIESLKHCLTVKINQLFNRQKRVNLIIIDSIASLFRGEEGGGNSKRPGAGFASRQEDIKAVARLLKDLAQNYDMPIVCVNQMSDVIDYKPQSALMQYYAGLGYFDSNPDPKIPCLGLAWSQFLTTRLHIAKHWFDQRSDVLDETSLRDIVPSKRRLSVLLSPNCPKTHFDFYITVQGLVEEL